MNLVYDRVGGPVTAARVGHPWHADCATIAISVAPNPITFVGFNPGHGMITWTATWNVTVRETAGRAGDARKLR